VLFFPLPTTNLSSRVLLGIDRHFDLRLATGVFVVSGDGREDLSSMSSFSYSLFGLV